MARYIEQGKSIFIPFQYGVSMIDSQLHLRMYKTTAAFERHCPKGGGEPELFEYAPIVRCKDCKHNEDCIRRIQFWGRNPVLELNISEYHPLDFCSYGERRTDGR